MRIYKVNSPDYILWDYTRFIVIVYVSFYVIQFDLWWNTKFKKFERLLKHKRKH